MLGDIKMKWISITEQMPKIETFVLVARPAYKGMSVTVATYKESDHGGLIWVETNEDMENLFFLKDVTHWMPLPLPPEAG